MAERSIEDVVKMILADIVGIDEDDITTDMKLDESDLDLDSLDQVGFAMDLEDAFGISISDKKIKSVETVGDVIELVRVARG